MQATERLPEEQSATLTRKGQVTIPAPIRKLLGVGPRDKVSFVVDQNGVRLKRGTSAVETTAGMFKTDQPAVSAEELREQAADAIAEGAVERMGA
jgi:antitoxin PrlF